MLAGYSFYEGIITVSAWFVGCLSIAAIFLLVHTARKRISQPFIIILVIAFSICLTFGFIHMGGVVFDYRYRPQLYSNSLSDCDDILEEDMKGEYGEQIGNFRIELAQLVLFQDCYEEMAVKTGNISICDLLPDIDDLKSNIGKNACISHYNSESLIDREGIISLNSGICTYAVQG